jgi:hypothetical protein
MNDAYPTDQEIPVVVMHVNLNELTFRTFIEPADDQVLHVYDAPRENMVETGDVVFRHNAADDVKFYRVDYATTLRYPAPLCAKACNALPYQLILQLDRITDETEVAQLHDDLKAMDKLPF